MERTERSEGLRTEREVGAARARVLVSRVVKREVSCMMSGMGFGLVKTSVVVEGVEGKVEKNGRDGWVA